MQIDTQHAQHVSAVCVACKADKLSFSARERENLGPGMRSPLNGAKLFNYLLKSIGRAPHRIVQIAVLPGCSAELRRTQSFLNGARINNYVSQHSAACNVSDKKTIYI